jgi:hypothetical protein
METRESWVHLSKQGAKPEIVPNLRVTKLDIDCTTLAILDLHNGDLCALCYYSFGDFSNGMSELKAVLVGH